MTRYVTVDYYCDHVERGHICHNRASGHESTIAQPAPWRDNATLIAGREARALQVAERDGWLLGREQHYCRAHRAEHEPAKPARARKPAAAPVAHQATLDELEAAVPP